MNDAEIYDQATKVGVRTPARGPAYPVALRAHREAFCAAMREFNARGPSAGKWWTVQFLIRRCAWHMLDHTWEMEDRDLSKSRTEAPGSVKLLHLTERREAMRAVRLLLPGVLLATSACTSPVPTGTPTPHSSEAVVATPTLPGTSSTPTVSSVASPSGESITCLAEPGPLPSGLQGDPCPSAIAAVRVVVASLAMPIARMHVEPGPFHCGDLWPGAGSPIVCFGAMVLPGTWMHGWVTFVGTDKVAAVELHRMPSHRWTPALRAFVVPPAGWVKP